MVRSSRDLDAMAYKGKRVKVAIEFYGVLERECGAEVILTGGRYPAWVGLTRYIRKDDVAAIEVLDDGR